MSERLLPLRPEVRGRTVRVGRRRRKEYLMESDMGEDTGECLLPMDTAPNLPSEVSVRKPSGTTIGDRLAANGRTLYVSDEGVIQSPSIASATPDERFWQIVKTRQNFWKKVRSGEPVPPEFISYALRVQMITPREARKLQQTLGDRVGWK